MKWVDNFIFFRELMNLFGCPQFPYRLSNLLTLTKPLGIPWHRIAKKGQDSASCFDYISFCWDIAARCVSVPHNKRMHAIHKVTTVLTTKTLSMRDVSLIIGMLQHLTFVYWNGRHALASIAQFLSKFPNSFVKHHLPTAAQCDLTWWHQVLARRDVSRLLIPLPCLYPDIWVDTLSSWGIGLIIKSQWAAWRLIEGWDSEDRDIGWTECVALELAVSWLAAENFHDAEVIIHSDNSGVVGTFWKGRSWNSSCNDSISHIAILLSQSNLSLSPIFVPSAQNCADPVSQGCLRSQSSCISTFIELPHALSSFLQHV